LRRSDCERIAFRCIAAQVVVVQEWQCRIACKIVDRELDPQPVQTRLRPRGVMRRPYRALLLDVPIRVPIKVPVNGPTGLARRRR